MQKSNYLTKAALNMTFLLSFFLLTSSHLLLASDLIDFDFYSGANCNDSISWCSSLDKNSCNYSLLTLFCRATCDPTCQTNVSGCEELNCTQQCIPSDDNSTSTSATCACFDGFSLAEDGRKCNDIDECAENSTLCSDIPARPFCQNLIGSYACVSCLAYKPHRLSNYFERNECCLKNKKTTCGKRNLVTGRIIETPTGFARRRWPWIVNIEIGNRSCGGVLISQKYVLTTAHCLENCVCMQNITIHAGVFSFEDINRNVHAQIFHAQQVLIHPDYTFPNNDVALVRLNSETVSSVYVSAICLPGGEQPTTGMKCYASGYGDATSREWTLQEVSLHTAEPSLCDLTDDVLTRADLTGTHLCAGNSIATDNTTCQGTSGGPLICQRCNNCDWYLAGITSIGKGCARAGSYTAFTNIREHERWITSITGLEFKEETCDEQSWLPWTSWSKCSAIDSIGNGSRYRTRSCMKGIPGLPGCMGDAKQKSPCSVLPPLDEPSAEDN